MESLDKILIQPQPIRTFEYEYVRQQSTAPLCYNMNAEFKPVESKYQLICQTDSEVTLISIITGNESRSFGYNPVSNQKLSEEKCTVSKPKATHQLGEITWSMFVIFCDIHKIVHIEIVPQCHTVNIRFYSKAFDNIQHNWPPW